ARICVRLDKLQCLLGPARREQGNSRTDASIEARCNVIDDLWHGSCLMPNGLVNCYDDLRFRDEVLAAGRFDFGLGRAVHGPRAPKASSSLMTFARSLTSCGTHFGNGTSLFTWRPEAVCSCRTCVT